MISDTCSFASERRPAPRRARPLFALLTLGFAGAAATGAQAACYNPQQQLPAQVVSDFNGNPGQLLTQYPGGGGQMISRIRDLAASDPGTLSGISGLMPNANKDQKSAIGTGLGQAAKICVADQLYVSNLLAAVAGDADARAGYQSVVADVATGATGGGGGAGAGSAGASGGATGASGVGPFSSTFQAINGNGVNTAPYSYTSSVTGTSSTGNTFSLLPTSTLSGSVSP